MSKISLLLKVKLLKLTNFLLKLGCLWTLNLSLVKEKGTQIKYLSSVHRLRQFCPKNAMKTSGSLNPVLNTVVHNSFVLYKNAVQSHCLSEMPRKAKIN